MGPAADPYDTQAMADWRARQRRLLRTVPPRLLQAGLRLPEHDYGDLPDRGYAEHLARQAADERTDRVVELLYQWQAESATRRWARFLLHERAPIYEPRPAHHVMEQVSQAAAEAASAVADGDPPADPLPEDAAQLVLLLQLADQLAPDGYRDPRLRSARNGQRP